jgi:hypothetical protein
MTSLRLIRRYVGWRDQMQQPGRQVNMDTKDIVTLIIALWGALLATSDQVTRRRERRRRLQVWLYWDQELIAKIRNVSPNPVGLRTCELRARYLSGLWRVVFRSADQTLSTHFPYDESLSGPLILAPGAEYVHTFEGARDQLETLALQRQELTGEKGDSAQYLEVGALVAMCIDHDDKVHSSRPYDLRKEPSPIYDETGEVGWKSQTFVLPEPLQPRRAPAVMRLASRLFRGKVT